MQCYSCSLFQSNLALNSGSRFLCFSRAPLLPLNLPPRVLSPLSWLINSILPMGPLFVIGCPCQALTETPFPSPPQLSSLWVTHITEVSFLFVFHEFLPHIHLQYDCLSKFKPQPSFLLKDEPLTREISSSSCIPAGHSAPLPSGHSSLSLSSHIQMTSKP